jgi:hypothetical protein
MWAADLDEERGDVATEVIVCLYDDLHLAGEGRQVSWSWAEFEIERSDA